MPYLEPFKEAKKTQNVSNNEIAVRSGTPLATVTKFFNEGSKNPSAITMSNIARVLNVSLDEVFGLKQPENKLDPNIEVIVNAHVENIKEKDEYIKEQNERIAQLQEDIKELRIEKLKIQKEKSKILTFAFVFACVVIFILLFDMMNGHFGYFRS